MPRYQVEVKAFISPTMEQIADYGTDHEPIGTGTGPFDIDGRSSVEEIDE